MFRRSALLLLAFAGAPFLLAGSEEPVSAGLKAAPPTPQVDALFDLPVTPVLPASRGFSVPMSPELHEALQEGRWSRAADLALELPSSNQQAFLASWCLVKARRAMEAEPLLDRMDGPPNWVLLTQAEVLVALGRSEEAIDALQLVDLDLPIGERAGLLLARQLEALGRIDEAELVYLELVGREGPRSGTPEALMWLARQHNEKTPSAYPFLRRIWYEYPGGRASDWAESVLRRHHRTPPTDWERARRAERLMWRMHTSDALAETRAILPKLEEGSEPWCRANYVRGRSYAMRWQLGSAVRAFGDAGQLCAGADGDFGERILWWRARSEGRLGHHTHASRDYALLGQLYPQSYLADDAMLKAGEHKVDTGDWAEAQELWREGLEELPGGDRTAETGFRLAWRRYVEGDTEEARRIANRIAAMPISSGRFDVPAARYWAARWALYPDVENPNRADPAGREEAVRRWVSLCEDVPWSAYAVLASMRLSEEAPEQAWRVARRAPQASDFEHSWLVGIDFRERSQDAIELARVGLMHEAHSAWDATIDEDSLSGDEYGWWLELRYANGEEVEAHADARFWIRTHPWDVNRARGDHLARLVYPRVFGEEVDRAAEPYDFAPLALQGLIRTESNFDHEVRSPAGARGLAQLMPFTARRVAEWDGETVLMRDLYEPEVNLALGARYLDFLYTQFQGNPFLAAAAYNAGEHRVESWLERWGNLPTDEFMERIPYPETRGYVKRSVGTWQAYELLYGEDERFPTQLSGFTAQAQPEGIQPLGPDPEP